MNSIEAGPQQSIDSTNDEVAEELPPLSDAAQKYLDELRQQLDQSVGYVVLYPNGNLKGNMGLSREYPALSFELALDFLARLFQLNNIQVGEICRKYKLVSPNDLSGLGPRFVLDIDNTIREI